MAQATDTGAGGRWVGRAGIGALLVVVGMASAGIAAAGAQDVAPDAQDVVSIDPATADTAAEPPPEPDRVEAEVEATPEPADAVAEPPPGPDGVEAEVEATPEPADAVAEPPPVSLDGPIRIVVLGDSLADGVWAGVYRALRRESDVTVDRHTRVASGLSRPDFYDWGGELSEFLASEDVDIAIVSIGLNDGQPVFHDGRWDHDFATPEWDEIYSDRVLQFMHQLVDAGVPTFWVGLPTVRSAQFDTRVRHMNAIYRAAAVEAGVHFVETRPLTADETGAYAAYLVDAEGRQRLMRANDGIHFTSRGYEMLGHALVDAMAASLGVFTDDDNDPA